MRRSRGMPFVVRASGYGYVPPSPPGAGALRVFRVSMGGTA